MPASRVKSVSPWHILLILDDSGSMQGKPSDDVNKAVDAMICELKLISQGLKPYFKISIISFGTNANLLCEAQSEVSPSIPKVLLNGASGSTNAAVALQMAYDVLQRNPGNPTDFTPFIFFLSDGVPDDEASALAVSDKLKTLNVHAGIPRIVTIGFGDVKDSFMQKLASNPELYKRLSRSEDIIKFFPDIGSTVTGPTASNGAEGVEKAIISL